MPAKQSRSAERRYRQMLSKSLVKNATESGVAAAANSAIGALSTVASCRDRGEAVSHEYLAQFSSGRGQPNSSSTAHEVGTWFGRTVAIVAVLAVCLVAVVLLPPWLRHAPSVSGIILLDRNPVSGIQVVFHHEAGNTEVRVTTGSGGEFTVESIPVGNYCVSLSSDDASRVPSAYCSPDSSPFRLHVERDLDNLQFFAVSKPSTMNRP